MQIPDPPSYRHEYDFRQTPTRISARAIGASWMLYEKIPGGGETVIALRGDWPDIYTHGVLVTRALDGRTVQEAKRDGVLA